MCPPYPAPTPSELERTTGLLAAATNAFSDIYAMGAKPLFALSVVGMPIDKLPVKTISAVLQGGRAICEELGVPIAGGHSIDSPEPIYGLVVIGKVAPDKCFRYTVLL